MMSRIIGAAMLTVAALALPVTEASASQFAQSQSVTPQQFLQAGERLSVDAGPAIRRALASGLPVRFPAGDYVVRPDPAATPRLAFRTYSIRIPDNAHLIFDPGARIVQAPGAGSWVRTVSFQDADNVRVEGELWVDANVSTISAANNEQMHGVMLFNTSNARIDAIRSENARGDNVMIGGDNNSAGSHDVWIGTIRASTAGRKNLVLHSVRNVRIDRAILDNRAGGARLYGGKPTGSDGHSLDAEPDKFTGAVQNSASIGEVVTYGSGNDFSAGTNARQASAYRLDIGTFKSYVEPRRGVAPWIQYAITVSVRDLQISGASGDSPSEIRYAARLLADRLRLTGSSRGKPLLWIAPARGEAPDVRIGTEDVRNATGPGVQRGGRPLWRAAPSSP